MKLSRKYYSSLLAGVLVWMLAFSGPALALCGDSTCGWINGTYACYVEMPDGSLKYCDEDDPCEVNCN